MSLPTTLMFAIRTIREKDARLTPGQVCDELSRLGWRFDVAEVESFVIGASGQRSTSLTESDSLPPRGLRASLPTQLQRALDEYEAVVGPRRSKVTPGLARPEWPRVVNEIDDALGHEIAAVRERWQERRIKLKAALVVGKSEVGMTVRWEADADVDAPEGATVKVLHRGSEHDAEVVRIDGTSITLHVLMSPVSVADEATLVVDASFLLQLRRDHLQRLRAGEVWLDQSAALGFLDPPEMPVAVDHGVPVVGLNEEQQAFVDRALGSGISWLWGPPGTGKTTTLAHLALELQARGLRTLFVSNTNAAVDTALLRLMELSADRVAGRLVRIGQPSAAEVSGHSTGPVTIDEVAGHYGLEVGTHLARTRSEIKKLRSRSNVLTVTLRDPVEAQRRGLFGVAGEDRFDLMRRLEAEGVEQELRKVEGELGLLIERRKRLEGLVELVEREIISRASTVFATVHQTYLSRLQGQQFDVVVIDEASMVSADLVVLAAGLGRGHTILAGDFRQLSPIAQSQSPSARRWLCSSAFDRARVNHAVAAGHPPENLIALATQHRMRPRIQDVIGGTFYREVGLSAGESVRRRDRGLPTGIDDELVLVDTSSLRPSMTKRQGRISRLNVTHAQIVESIAASVRPGYTFGAVSPFSPQARLLQSLVDGREGQAASTVHRFQGGERDVMVWDMTEGRSGATKMTSWFDAMSADDEGARLVNVALSRARDQLYVVADLDRARAGCRDTSIIRRTLDLVGSAGTLIDAQELLLRTDSRTRLSTLNSESPLHEALREDPPWIVLWCGSPPSHLTTATVQWLSRTIAHGRHVYIRAGVPGNDAQREALSYLQALGCQVQLVRPCRENLIITPMSVYSSYASLVSPGPTQPWLATKDATFAGTVLRMVSRRGDANPTLGEPDATCSQGHPMLLDRGRDEDYRICLTCDAPKARPQQTGRSRDRHASVSAASCGSCGSTFDLSGWCQC